MLTNAVKEMSVEWELFVLTLWAAISANVWMDMLDFRMLLVKEFPLKLLVNTTPNVQPTQYVPRELVLVFVALILERLNALTETNALTTQIVVEKTRFVSTLLEVSNANVMLVIKAAHQMCLAEMSTNAF